MKYEQNDTREVLWASFFGLFLTALTVTWWWYAMR